MRYFKRPWEEPRGDEHAAWGSSVYFLEVGQDAYVTRQLEVYENGTALKYDDFHRDDAYGGLADQPLDLEEEGFLPFEVSQADFEAAWRGAQAINR